MQLGAVLPHTRLYGGVKRFIELGNVFMQRGHAFTIYTPSGNEPDWIRTDIRMASFEDLRQDHNEMLFFTERKLKSYVLDSDSRYKIYYHVSRRSKSRKIVKDSRFHIFACSGNVYRHDKLWFGVTPFLAAGGINSQLFFPKEIRERKEGEPFTIMVYGRLTEHIKGTELVVEACERLHGKYPFIRLLLFDTPVNESMSNAIASFQSSIPFEFVLNHPVEQNVALFHKADIFVAAEKQTGWANTVAEAMAAGIPVVATRSGTLDILYNHETGIRVRRNVRSIMHGIESLLLSLELRRMLAENARRHIVKFDWQILADRILDWYHEKEKA